MKLGSNSGAQTWKACPATDCTLQLTKCTFYLTLERGDLINRLLSIQPDVLHDLVCAQYVIPLKDESKPGYQIFSSNLQLVEHKLDGPCNGMKRVKDSIICFSSDSDNQMPKS